MINNFVPYNTIICGSNYVFRIVRVVTVFYKFVKIHVYHFYSQRTTTLLHVKGPYEQVLYIFQNMVKIVDITIHGKW